MWSHPLQAAVAAGLGAHTVGEAFFAGYQAAVERLTGQRAVQSLLVNEPPAPDSAGPPGPPGHPRSIRAGLADGEVTGHKAFALDAAEVYWVLVRTGPMVDGRIPFGLARVDADSAGVSRTPMPMSWLQDVPHCAVRFENAPSTRVLHDAWSRFVRRFRTIEDLGVLTAVSAARLGDVAFHAPDRGRAEEEEEDWIAVLMALDALWSRVGEGPGSDAAAALDPLVVRGLAGVRSRVLALFDAEPPIGPLAESWATDIRLFGIGRAPRSAQLRAARQRWRATPERVSDPASDRVSDPGGNPPTTG